MGSGFVDTTASSAADVGRDVVAATVATVAARGLEPQDATPGQPRARRSQPAAYRLLLRAPPSASQG